MKKKALTASFTAVVVSSISLFAQAQDRNPSRPPAPRMHKIVAKKSLRLLPATSTPADQSEVTIEIVGDQRVIRSNGIPNHKTGKFPNRGNPNRISVQTHEYHIPAEPEVADQITPMHGEFGVAVNGIPFDPGAAEFYDGEPGWQYEPLSGAIALGIDVSHAHVQPTGKYHYHGLPTGLINSVQVESGKHSPLIGWAADGFPMYAVYGYSDSDDADSAVEKLTSSYQLKKGRRPGGNAPGGSYDGTFVRDYEYESGSGDLDECNGRQCVTPEFPDGTYAYFMTEEWPVVPRNYRGTPSDDFKHGPGAGGPGNKMAGGPMGVGGQNAPGGQIVFGEGGGPPGGRPTPGEVLPARVLESLNLSSRQQKQINALQTLVYERLEKILTETQRQALQNSEPPSGAGPEQASNAGPPPGGPEGFGGGRGGKPGGPPGTNGPPGGGRPSPGEILPSFVLESLNLTTKQMVRLESLQKSVYARLRSILSNAQQQQLMRGGPPGGGPPRMQGNRGRR